MRAKFVWSMATLALLSACNPPPFVIPDDDDDDAVGIDGGVSPGLDASKPVLAQDAAAARDATASNDASVSQVGEDLDAATEPSTDAQLDAKPATPDSGVPVGNDLPDSGQPDAGASCPDGLPVGERSGAQKQLAEHSPTIEGVAVCPNGQVFVTSASNSEIWSVPIDGSPPKRWAAVPGRLFAGLTCDDRGRLFAADFGRNGSDLPRSAVLIEAEGSTGTALPAPADDSALSGLNGIAAVSGRGIYASDTSAGLLVLYREQDGRFTSSVVARDLPGANGLAFASASKRLYLALTDVGGGDNAIVSFAVADDGSLSDQQTLWTGPNIVDGLAVDDTGDLYGALNSEGRVVRLSDGATVGQATNPASLAFRGGALLFTDYDLIGSLLEVAVGGVFTTGRLFSVQLGVCGGL